MANANSDQQEGPGYECHDCGEVYAPGADTSACVNDGHYVGPLVECALPYARPVANPVPPE